MVVKHVEPIALIWGLCIPWERHARFGLILLSRSPSLKGNRWCTWSNAGRVATSRRGGFASQSNRGGGSDQVLNKLKRTIHRSALFLCALLLLSCASRLPSRSFRVLPATPDYLLQSPDSVETPFADVLHTYNGFEASWGSVDLRPKMELRVENAYFREGICQRRGMDGFLGTGVARYEVRLQGALRLRSGAFDGKSVLAINRQLSNSYRLPRETISTSGFTLKSASIETEIRAAPFYWVPTRWSNSTAWLVKWPPTPIRFAAEGLPLAQFSLRHVQYPSTSRL